MKHVVWVLMVSLGLSTVAWAHSENSHFDGCWWADVQKPKMHAGVMLCVDVSDLRAEVFKDGNQVKPAHIVDITREGETIQFSWASSVSENHTETCSYVQDNTQEWLSCEMTTHWNYPGHRYYRIARDQYAQKYTTHFPNPKKLSPIEVRHRDL